MGRTATVATGGGDAVTHEQAARAHVELAHWWRSRGEHQLARREVSRAAIRRRAAEIQRDLDVADAREAA
jgi:hypothetical protein